MKSVDNSIPPLPRSTPEAEGIASATMSGFLAEVQDSVTELHSFMLLRNGHVVAEGWWDPYRPDEPHTLFSLSKSFTSTAAGLAIAEGKLSLDDPVLSFFPEEAPAEVSANLVAMRVRHLLCMGTGHHDDTTPHLWGSALEGEQCPDEPNWARAFLARPVEHEPGTHFVYNSGATYMVSAIVQKVTGQRLVNYLAPRLFEPLGITHATWETCPRGIDTGGWGLSITTEEIARFGLLYLQNGVWNGRQVLPEEWVQVATQRHIAYGDDPASDWCQGYCYQFWRCRHIAYRGDGAFGQFCVVMPEQNMLFVSTAGVKDMQAVLNLVWKHLLPASNPGTAPVNAAAQETLIQTLGSLKVSTPQGKLDASIAGAVSGKTYRLESNEHGWESIRFDFEENETTLNIRNMQGEQVVPVGREGCWLRSEAALLRKNPHTIAASGAWANADTFTLRLSYCDTPFCPALKFCFTDIAVKIEETPNVGFNPKTIQVVGATAESANHS